MIKQPLLVRYKIHIYYLPNKKLASKWLICTERKNGLTREYNNSRNLKTFAR